MGAALVTAHPRHTSSPPRARLDLCLTSRPPRPLSSPRPQNKLKDYLYVSLTSLENIAALRARAIIHDKVTTRLRFFSASESLDSWSVLDLAPVYRALRDALTAGINDDPGVWLRRDYDVFAAQRVHVEYTTFLAHRDAARTNTVGTTRTTPSFSAVLDEIYSPTNEDNTKTDELVKSCIVAWLTGMLNTLENGQGSTYVDDGVYSEANQTPEMKRALAGTKRNTNNAESYFGSLKYYISQFGAISTYLADACVAADRDDLFSTLAPQYEPHQKQRVADEDASRSTIRRRAKYRGHDGRLNHLAPELRLATVEFAQREGRAMFLSDARARDDAADAAELQRRKDDEDAASKRLVDEYVKAGKKFNFSPVIEDAEVSRMSVPRLTSRLDAYLARINSAQATRVLRGTIERYQFGMGLPVGPTKYTSGVDATIGAAGSDANVQFLRATLIECWREIKDKKLTLREEAYVPAMHKRKLAVLGTATQQRADGESRELLSAEDLRAAAAARQTHPSHRRAAASSLPPLTTALIGERVEVCFDIEYDDGNGETYNGLFWFGGEIIKLGGREHGGGQKGTIVIKFDDGTTESLLANRPTLWEVEQAGAWCFERPNDDDDDGEGPVEDEPEPVVADAEDEEDACGDDEMAADDE